MRSVGKCFEILDLPPTATAAQVTARFRRLARELHPDINPTPAGRRRFVEVVEAHAILRDALKVPPEGSMWGRCPRCGLYDHLLDAVGGGQACPDCLLGRNYRSYFLPLPIFVVARHLAVFALYAAAIVLGVLFAQTAEWHLAAVSLLCAMLGFVTLAVEVLLVTRANPHSRPPTRANLIGLPRRSR